MEVTFGAVGDLISIGLLIKDIVQALSDSRGSSRNYQQLVACLNLLDKTLTQVHDIYNFPSNATATTVVPPPSQIAIAQAVITHIRHGLESFKQRSQKYEAALGPGGSGNAFQNIRRKIQWKFEEGDLVKFRDEVNMHTQSLGILLESLNMHAIQQNRAELNNGLIKLWDQTQAALRAGHISLAELFGRFGTRVLIKLNTITRLATDINECTRQVLSVGQSIFEEARAIRTFLTRLECPLGEEQFLLEDALGRRMLIHLRTITSWNAFEFVLNERFKGQKGARRIAHNRYLLAEQSNTRRLIDRSMAWEAAFRPAQTVAMSLMCRDDGISLDPYKASCPRCRTVSSSDAEDEVECRNCHMIYRRVVEIDEDEDLDTVSHAPAQPPQRSLPRFSAPSWRNLRQESRSTKKRPREEDPDALDACFACGQAKRQKTTPGKYDSDSDDGDMTGLLRITIMSQGKTQHSNENHFRSSQLGSSDCSSEAEPKPVMISLNLSGPDWNPATAGDEERMDMDQTPSDGAAGMGPPSSIQEAAMASTLPSLSSTSRDLDSLRTTARGSEYSASSVDSIGDMSIPSQKRMDCEAPPGISPGSFGPIARKSSGDSTTGSTASCENMSGKEIERRIMEYRNHAKRLSTEGGREAYKLPQGKYTKDRQPRKTPILVQGIVFDASSLGSWIFDQTGSAYGVPTRESNIAGELWLLLTQLFDNIDRLEGYVGLPRWYKDRDDVMKYLHLADRLVGKFQHLLKECGKEIRPTSGAETNLQDVPGAAEFVRVMFGKDRMLGDTEEFLDRVRDFNADYDAHCVPIFRKVDSEQTAGI